MSKVKNILFRLNLNGNGIVNFDSSDQKFMFNGTNLHNMKTIHDNTSYAKKKFYKDENGNFSYKISISSDCLRHDIFKEDVQFQSPNVINSDHLLYSFIASPASIIRGYLFADEKETLKRKGALTITDAEQTCNAVSSIETFSRSGYKNSDENKEKADNSFYKKEVVGDIKYQAIGNIDLMQLSFISCDQIFDRYSFNPDMFNVYKTLLATKLKGFNPELGYYQIKGSVVEIPEYGFKMTDSQVVALVKELFTRLLKLNILRKGAYAEVAELEYKLVYDVIEDTFSNEENWNKLSSLKDVENLNFEIEEFYIDEDIELAKEKRAMIEADYEKRKTEGKANKAAKKEAANAKKETDKKVELQEEETTKAVAKKAPVTSKKGKNV